MLTTICEKITWAWTSSRKTRSNANGWISANAACCHHNGERADQRGRGGLMPNSDGSVTYHCFNCGYKAYYKPGMIVSHKFRKLLSWMGMDWEWIQLLVIESIRVKDLAIELGHVQEDRILEYVDKKPLPPDTVTFSQIVEGSELSKSMLLHFENCVRYLQNRHVDPFGEFAFAVTSCSDHGLNQRLIVPFEHNGQIMGYNSRRVDKNHPRNVRWFSSHPKNFVFNLDRQAHSVVLVFEGMFDAISMDGVSTLGAGKITDDHADFIDSLNKPVIFVPQADKRGLQAINQALEYDWHVSMPVWLETCKDANDAVVKYGKLFTLRAILDNYTNNKTKIKLLQKQFAKSIG